MAKPTNETVLVEALMRFPYRDRAYFPGQQFVVANAAEAQGLVDAKAAKIIGAPKPGYQRADMQPKDRPER